MIYDVWSDSNKNNKSKNKTRKKFHKNFFTENNLLNDNKTNKTKKTKQIYKQTNKNLQTLHNLQQQVTINISSACVEANSTGTTKNDGNKNNNNNIIINYY